MKATIAGLCTNVLKKISYIFLDKYLLATAIFVVWVGFFDQNSLMTQVSLSQTLSDLRTERQFLEEEIEVTREKKEDITKNKEKYARERFYMKKPGEQIYLIEQ